MESGTRFPVQLEPCSLFNPRQAGSERLAVRFAQRPECEEASRVSPLPLMNRVRHYRRSVDPLYIDADAGGGRDRAHDQVASVRETEMEPQVA